MNAQTRGASIDWIPDSGFQLRKAGVHFDAVRVDGDDGRRLADLMVRMTGGDPGPVVTEANGCRGVYFLLPAASTVNRSWPRGVIRYNSAMGCAGYVPVPALEGPTWPLAWRFPPAGDGRFVHPLLLRTAAIELLG
ncbi:hypothetical protein [Streptomyces sp. NPDC059881]|uniref:hypothetical protein n=1 Tax=Streptomyces sp. NPDC059881 TaxID=3346986 RepID=UPI00364F3C21